MEMRALSSVGARLRAWLETFFYLSALKSKMREQIGSWLEMLLVPKNLYRVISYYQQRAFLTSSPTDYQNTLSLSYLS